MQTQYVERRRVLAPMACATIRHSLQVQQRSGTVSAIEYLKSKNVSGATIERVLSGTDIRTGDH